MILDHHGKPWASDDEMDRAVAKVHEIARKMEAAERHDNVLFALLTINANWNTGPRMAEES